MSEGVRDLLVRGIAAAKARDKDEARFYLEWALRLDPSTEQCIDAWYWLSEISDDPTEKRNYLEEILGSDPSYYPARRSLAILDGRLDPKDIVDPDRLPPAQEAETADARRFVCPKCGGRLTYTPDGKSLICEYCESRKAFESTQTSPALDLADKDFTIALATARGHTKPMAIRSFKCKACGAPFFLSPSTISAVCPYCASVYVLEVEEEREIIPPDGIIPFSLGQEKSKIIFHRWLGELSKEARTSPPRGFYLPVWIFAISGPISWDCMIYKSGDWQPHSGKKLAAFQDIAVPASRGLRDEWADELDKFSMESIKPYDPSFLANWPAEVYQISLSDASLKARWLALERVRQALKNTISETVKDLKLNSMDLLIESFRQVLFPLYLAHYNYQNSNYPVLINGQTGAVRGKRPPGGIRKWIARLLDGEDSTQDS